MKPICSGYLPFNQREILQQLFVYVDLRGCESLPTYFKDSKSCIYANWRIKNPGIWQVLNHSLTAKKRLQSKYSPPELAGPVYLTDFSQHFKQFFDVPSLRYYFIDISS